MANNTELSDEIVFASSDSNVSRIINQAEKEGKLRKIAPRIYTTNLQDSEEYIIKRHFFDLLKLVSLSRLLATAVHWNCGPTETGNFFITSNYTKK